MHTTAVVIEAPFQLSLTELELPLPGADDVVVEMAWSGISSGTERLLWSGRMPHFPGLAYPLVPGYESVGRVIDAGADQGDMIGRFVFVPGAACYGDIRGLFGGAASRVVVAAHRIIPIEEALADRGVLLALAATAYHAIATANGELPDLIVGHGVFGRLLARLATALGDEPPTVWEVAPQRREGGRGYRVCEPEADDRRDYRAIYDASGDAGVVNTLISRLAPRGELVLAGFYSEPVSFDFPPAFMREARLRVAAEWQPDDLVAVTALVNDGRLNLEDLITHRFDAAQANAAYSTAFEDGTCLKMILDWSKET